MWSRIKEVLYILFKQVICPYAPIDIPFAVYCDRNKVNSEACKECRWRNADYE